MLIFPDPPYFLLVAGLLASLAAGVAFDATLKQAVQEWSQTRSGSALIGLQGIQLFLPYVGIAVGACVFLASGIEIFGFPRLIAYALSAPLTLGIGWLVWTQLGQILVQLQRGGSRAIDLDSWE